MVVFFYKGPVLVPKHTSQLGLGNECTVDMGDMLSGCPDYDCYTNATVRLHFVSVNKSVLNWIDDLFL